MKKATKTILRKLKTKQQMLKRNSARLSRLYMTIDHTGQPTNEYDTGATPSDVYSWEHEEDYQWQ